MMKGYVKMIIKHQDLLAVDADIIVQQSNCVTIKSHGLSEVISKKYPYADPYSRRQARSANMAAVGSRGIPGTCQILIPGTDESGPKVACLMGQICPGKPGAWCRPYNIDPSEDTSKMRLIYFERASDELAKYCGDNSIKTVAFPYKIGSGLAGGDWTKYEALLQKFDESVAAEVIICKL